MIFIFKDVMIENLKSVCSELRSVNENTPTAVASVPQATKDLLVRLAGSAPFAASRLYIKNKEKFNSVLALIHELMFSLKRFSHHVFPFFPFFSFFLFRDL
jgi:hypothetical protein